jgi:quinoprotein glucose dehydrogenase
MAKQAETRRFSRSLVVLIVGALLSLIGVVLVAGGVWLAALGGSIYYLLAGLGLLASGLLLLRGDVRGGYLYLAVFVLTLVWALWEVGLNPWALVPRVIGPAVLAILVLLALPLLEPGRWTWLKSGGGVAAVLALLLLGIIVSPGYLRQDPRGLPPVLAAAMADPSLMPIGADWPAYGGTYAARRFSPLAQITPANVGTLERAWVYHTGDLPPPNPNDIQDNYGAETTPLKVGDSLYLCSAKGIMIALDPATGKERWRFDPKVPDKFIPYTAACRGVSYYAVPDTTANTPCAARIIEGTLDARLIAVDARTGKLCPDFGTNGQVDITAGMGSVYPGLVSITSPPTIVRGIVVTGHQVLDGQQRDAPSGVFQGYDAVTGELKWAWDMMHPDWTKGPPPGQTYARGTPNMWTIASGDEQLGLVYLPMGNSAVDYWSSTRRPPENEYATSLVALDVATGKPRWSFRAVHKDVWDYDFGGQASLVDFPSGAGTVPALVLPSKQGDIYILDRRNGRPLFPVQERQVPQGGVEPQQRTPSQPFSAYHTLAFPMLTERDMWGMSPIDQMICRIQYHEADYRGMYTPPRADKRTIQYPGYNGGTDWGGVAVDPLRSIIVANYNNMPNYVRLVPRAEANKKGWAPRSAARGGDMGSSSHGAGDPQWGSPYAVSVNAGWRLGLTGLLCKQPPYGGIRAIDLRTGRTIWDRPFGSARRNGPWGIPSGLPFEIGTPNNGGVVVTASGLIFISAATDDVMRAIDLATGRTLWIDKLPAGGQASPMTYEANGRQYVLIMAGGHHFMETPIGDELIAYALPQGSGR